MAEMERTRERERAPLEDNTYERSMRARKEWTERGLTVPSSSQDDREWFQARQGKLFITSARSRKGSAVTGGCSCVSRAVSASRHQGAC